MVVVGSRIIQDSPVVQYCTVLYCTVVVALLACRLARRSEIRAQRSARGNRDVRDTPGMHHACRWCFMERNWRPGLHTQTHTNPPWSPLRLPIEIECSMGRPKTDRPCRLAPPHLSLLARRHTGRKELAGRCETRFHSEPREMRRDVSPS